MGVLVDVQELSCSIPPSRFFKAFILDSDNLMPKLLPVVIKSIELIEGNGGPGSVKLITYSNGERVNTMKHRVEELDETKYVYKFTITEGSNMGDDFESVSTVNEVAAGLDGGCVLKATTTYNTKGDNLSYIQEEIEKAKGGLVAFFNAAVAHLHSNPNEYN